MTCSMISWRASPAIPAFSNAELEARAGIGQLQILAIVIDMAHICQGKYRLAAVAFASCHRGNRPGRSHGGLGSIADAIFLDSFQNPVPIQLWPAPITGVWCQWLGRLPLHILKVVDAALDGRECPALARQGNAGAHGMVTDELHHLRPKLLPFR